MNGRFEMMDKMMDAFTDLDRAIAKVDEVSREVVERMREQDPEGDYPNVPKLKSILKVLNDARPAYIMLASLVDLSPTKDGDSE